MISTSEWLDITATVLAGLDTSVTVYRATQSDDGYGHKTELWISQGTVVCNVTKPSATMLQAFASKIGTQRAMLLRFMQTSDIRENDRISYDSKNWLVQNIQNAESYTVTKEALMTVIV